MSPGNHCDCVERGGPGGHTWVLGIQGGTDSFLAVKGGYRGSARLNNMIASNGKLPSS